MIMDGEENYGSRESYTVRTERGLMVASASFETEECCDKLVIRSTKYSDTSRPENELLAAGDTMS